MIFYLFLIPAYSCFLFFLTFYWNKKNIQKIGPDLNVSVLVAFRNEEQNFSNLIHSFKQLKYSADLLDFIFINDHSSDGSLAKLEELLIDFPFENQTLSLPEEKTGKKEAIILGVEASDAEIIISTDADCTVSTDWIQLMQSAFYSTSIHMVSGNVVFKAKSFWDRIFQMEFAPLIGVGAVGIKVGKAGMANGANLAFRRVTFLALDPYNDNVHIPTGDDVFLLQKIAKSYPDSIHFEKSAIVVTNPPKNILQFVNQRIRWASKWKAAADNKSKLPALIVWIFHFLYLIGLLTFITQNQYFFTIGLILIKALAEFIFIYSILNSQKQRFSILAFLILQVFYSFYVVLFGLLANFAAYQWKGRSYGKHER